MKNVSSEQFDMMIGMCSWSGGLEDEIHKIILKPLNWLFQTYLQNSDREDGLYCMILWSGL